MVHYHLTIIADVVNEEEAITDVVKEVVAPHQTEDGIDSIQQQHSIK